MAEITRHALRVYSALAALKGKGGDVLDALIPFFDPILKLMDGKVFEPRLVVSGARKMYKWRITREIVEQFIPRLEALNLLERHGVGRKATYIVTYQNVLESDDSKEITDTFEAIIDEFEQFPQVVTDLLNYSRSRDELADILIRFLVSSNVLFQASGSLPNEITGDLDNLETLPEGGRPLPEYDRYMAARFVQHLLRNRPELVPHLSRFASIGLLTEVVDDFVRPTEHADQVDLTVVVDAPLALDYLGLSGKEIQTDIRTVLDGLGEIGCKVVVFPVTCGEMSLNLKALLENSPPDRHGYTHSAMIAGEVMPEYVLAVANNPEAALQKNGIEIKDVNLTHFPGLHKYFTREMHDDFMSQITWGKDVRAKEHDADCLTLLMRLREGKHSRDIFKTRYVFVTRNVSFARQSRRYCIDGRQVFENQEGPVIHQRDLATITWLRTGLGASEIIPRTHLIAYCNRVLQVRPELTDAVKEKLRSFSQEKLEQYQLLLLDQRSVRKLADATLNDERVVTGENAEELLELMRQATAAEVKADYEQRMDAEKKKYAQAQRSTRTKYVGELLERDEQVRKLRESLEEAEKERADLIRHSDQVVSTMLSSVNRSSKVFRSIATGALILVAGAFIVNTLTDFIPETNSFWKWSLRVLGVVGIYETVAGLLHWPQYGLSHILNWKARRKLRSEIAKRGLSSVTANDFDITEGRVTKATPLIQHDPNELPSNTF